MYLLLVNFLYLSDFQIIKKLIDYDCPIKSYFNTNSTVKPVLVNTVHNKRYSRSTGEEGQWFIIFNLKIMVPINSTLGPRTEFLIL